MNSPPSRLTAGLLRSLPAILLLCAGWGHGLTVAQTSSCGPLTNGYGPYDYRRQSPSSLAIVENYHFKPETESMLRGITGPAGTDIAYTLRVFPNHHRALLAMIRLGDKEKSPQPRGSEYSVECWLERAVRYTPDDTVARLIYAQFLAKTNRVQEAAAQLEKAENAALDNPLSHYNIGLLYFEIKNYDKALTQAHKALAMGLPKQDLAESLRKVGKWQDPPAQEPATADPAASAATTSVATTPK